MPNQRAPGQTLINFTASIDFREEVDGKLAKTEYDDRSKFIRDAIVEKFARCKVEFNKALAKAPSRKGKGGRPKKALLVSLRPTANQAARKAAADAEAHAQGSEGKHRASRTMPSTNERTSSPAPSTPPGQDAQQTLPTQVPKQHAS